MLIQVDITGSEGTMRVNKYGIIKRGIAVGLMAIMACVNPMQTLSPVGGGAGVNGSAADGLTGVPTTAKAAEKSDPYVGEVRLAVDANPEVAKLALSSAGYEVIDQDLNESAGSSWNKLGDQAVYMGIKRTADEKKAIRDMKTMNMLGKYSYSDMENWLENNRQSARGIFEPLLTALKELRANYKNKDMLTLTVKEMLDRVTEDDSGKTLGEIFFDKDCDETVIMKIVLEGNQEVVKTVLYHLSMTYEATDDTWLDRLSGITKKSLTKEYTRKMYGVDQVAGDKKSEVERLMNAEFEEDANKLLERWDEIHDVIAEGTSLGTLTSEDVKRIMEVGEDQFYEELVDKTTVLRDNAFVEGLKAIPYNGKTLLELFKLDKSVFIKDITRLYPVVAALSSGQRAMLDYVRLDKLMEYAFIRKSQKENRDDFKSNEDIIEQSINDTTEISVYEGIDRAMFKEGAAMTSRATEAMTSEGADAGKDLEKVAKWAAVTFGVSTFLTMVSSFLTACMRDEYLTHKSLLERGYLDYLGFGRKDRPIYVEFYKKEVQIYTVLSGAFAVIAAVAAIVAITTYVKSQYQTHNRNQLPIPTVMVDRDVESEITGYIAYSAVRWNRDRQDDSGRDDRADLNGDAADQWLALYTTTDKAVGEPILADSIIARTGVKLGNQSPGTGYSPLTMFGRESIQNLIDEEYSFNDEVGGIYLWYQKGTQDDVTDDVIDDVDDSVGSEEVADAGSEEDKTGTDAGDEADTTGSNISGGTYALVGTGCGVGGFIIGLICMYFIRRKKVVSDK